MSTPPTDSITLDAHAKINLALAVGPVIQAGSGSASGAGNVAGMHPIASWMAPIALADRVTLVRTADDASSGRGGHDIRWADGRPVDWPIEKDLAVRAHALLDREAGPLPVRIRIEKHIPAGGGLGGGSADAAAVLRGLNAMFALGMPAGRLRALAAELGSDIPFFIPPDSGKGSPDTPTIAALVTGIGGEIEPAPIRAARAVPVVLIFPPFGCPTGEVYRAFDSGPARPFRAGEVAELARLGVVDPASLFNDLAEPAIAVRPELGRILGTIERGLGLPVHVSGSGSTLFCIGTTPEAVEQFLPEQCAAIGSLVLS